MGPLSIFFIGVSLSMDAFAVSLCKGLKMQKLKFFDAIVTAIFFGGFQALMPLIGWFVGSRFESYIVSFDHWIIFSLLLFVGGKMIIDARRGDDEEGEGGDALDIKELFLLAFVTSIDALAVGITFSFLQEVSIFGAISIIGVTTFVLSLAGVAIGNRFGARFKNRAQLFGGAVLILIGAKILLEHLGIL